MPHLCRYNIEEVLINSGYNIYWSGICSTIWPQSHHQFYVGCHHSLHFYAPGLTP
jgi:hypothetical protein